jgi:hypothetical protein
MADTRLVRFVGGPLHGESREIENAGDSFPVTGAAATALRKELSGEDPFPEIDSDASLTYTRLRGGEYYLEIPEPEGIESLPSGFVSEWCDAGPDRFLLKVTGPDTGWGSGSTEVIINSIELLKQIRESEPVEAFSVAVRNIERQEARMARSMAREDVSLLANRVGRGGELTAGNLRLISAMLHEFAVIIDSK